VNVAADAARLIIAAADGSPLAEWPAGDVRLVDGPDEAGRFRLARLGSDERLTFAAAEAVPVLEAHCPRLRKGAYGGPSWRAVIGWTAAGAGALAFIVFVVLPLVAQEAADWVPPRLEVALGEQAADAITAALTSFGRTGGECKNANGMSALDRLTAPLIAAARMPYPIRIRVIKSDMVNALALPGGQILVLKGLIDFVKSPNELAGVLGHELAHIELRHPIELVIKRSAVAFLVGLLLGDVLGGSAAAAAAEALAESSYSRDAESAADARSIALMTSAGLDPAPFAQFFKRLAAEEGSSAKMAPFVASHPPTVERERLAERVQPGGRAALDDEGWRALTKICD
jgi:Zn-dependent protease with chaperone function